MSDTYDVAVVGLGGIGGHAALRLAERGLSVLGLDAYRPPHTVGSSHGNSRVIREAYYEGLQYVPLVRRALRSLGGARASDRSASAAHDRRRDPCGA